MTRRNSGLLKDNIRCYIDKREWEKTKGCPIAKTCSYYGDEKCHVNYYNYFSNIYKSLYQYVLFKNGIKKVRKFDFDKR